MDRENPDVKQTLAEIKASVEEALSKTPMDFSDAQPDLKELVSNFVASVGINGRDAASKIGFVNKTTFLVRGRKSGYKCLITTDQGQPAAMARGVSYRKLKRWAAKKLRQLEGVMFVNLTYTPQPPVEYVKFTCSVVPLPIEDVTDCCKENT